VSLLRRKTEDASPESTPVVDEPGVTGKGRPTPKRRRQAGPVTPAPRTRKEAVAWQKAQRKKPDSKVAGQKQLSGAEFRDLLKKGDPRVLPARDQGELRALARDYVDSRRMFSNYLLLLFPFMLLGYAIPAVQYGVLLCFLLIVVEWFFTARSIKRLALERGIAGRDGKFSLAMYAGSRAYFPRNWRRPQPRVGYGDEV